MNKNKQSILLLLLALALISTGTILIFTKVLPRREINNTPVVIKAAAIDDYYDEDALDAPLYKMAVEAHRKKDFTGAVGLLKKQINRQPSHSQAYYLLAKTYEDNILPGHQGKMLTDMKAHYLTYLQQKPNGVRAREVKLKLAKNYLRLGINSKDTENLEKAYDLLTTLDSSDVELKMTLGAYYLAKNKNLEAIKEFQDVLDVPSGDAKTKFNSMGLAYIKTGNFSDATKVLEMAVAIDPANDYAYNNLGVAYLKTGRFAKARTSFEKAVFINPDNQKALENLSWMDGSAEIKKRIAMEKENSRKLEEMKRNKK